MVAGRTAWSAGYFVSHSSATSANAGAAAGFCALSSTEVSPSNSLAAIFVAAASASFRPRDPGPARFALRRPWWSTKTHQAPFHSLTFTPTFMPPLVLPVHFTRRSRYIGYVVKRHGGHASPSQRSFRRRPVSLGGTLPSRRRIPNDARGSCRRGGSGAGDAPDR